MTGPHAAVKHELLVRHLDAWTPAVLHGHKRATYVDACADAGASALAAAQVFAEFADLLDRHTITMLLLGGDSNELTAVAERVMRGFSGSGPPPGLVVEIAPGPVTKTLGAALKRVRAMGSPIFAWFDAGAHAPPSASAVATVAQARSSEVLLALPCPAADEAYRAALTGAGLDLVSRVEMVDAEGVAELLIFGTSSEKNLEKFKDELWALDEYAGIRLRDPVDEERTLLDISVQPHLGPLRRALAAHVADTGGSTVAELRSWAVHETVFRSADATKAVQALVAAGTVTREPPSGRLSPTTLIMPRPATPASPSI